MRRARGDAKTFGSTTGPDRRRRSPTTAWTRSGRALGPGPAPSHEAGRGPSALRWTWRVARGSVLRPSRLRGGQFLRRLLFRVLRPYLVRRQELDDALVDALRELDGRLRATRAELDEQLTRESTRRAAAPQAAAKHLDAASEPPRTRSTLAHPPRARAARAAVRLRPDPPARPTETAGEAIGFAVDQAGPVEDVYRGFEDVFRGSEDFIRERQRLYLELVGTRAPVLDVGCGRGEFLDLLSEAGIEARASTSTRAWSRLPREGPRGRARGCDRLSRAAPRDSSGRSSAPR